MAAFVVETYIYKAEVTNVENKKNLFSDDEFKKRMLARCADFLVFWVWILMLE